MANESIPDRNPSPPPEVLSSFADLVPDKIGETVFSKHWLFTTLMNVIQAVEKEDQQKLDRHSSPRPSLNALEEKKDTGSDESLDVLELDGELEEEVCNLWDMSTNSDIAHFLHEFKAVEIFLAVIDKTKSPRLVEIAVGILGNMASFSDLCESMSTKNQLVKVILQLMGSSDAPTLVQVVRMVHTCIVNDVTVPHWLQEIKDNSNVVASLFHILANSLNGELLKGTLHLIYYVLDRKDELCVHWGQKNYIEALCNSATQLHSLNDYCGLDEFWHVMHLLCQHEEPLSILAQLFPEIFPLLCDYITKFEENDVLLPPPDRIPAVSAAISVLSAVFPICSKLNKDPFEVDEGFLCCVKKMLCSLNEKLSKDSNVLPSENPAHEVTSSACNSYIGLQDECNNKSFSIPPDDNYSDSQNSLNKKSFLDKEELEDYNYLIILQESLCNFVRVIIPSLNQESDIRKALMQVLKPSKKSPTHTETK